MRQLRGRVTNVLVIVAMFFATMLVSCSAEDEGLTPDGDDADEITEATRWVDTNLAKYYLYNDEYRSMERDLTLNYDEFLNSTLMSMTTNVLDKKFYEEIYHVDFYDYLIYSSITRESVTKSRSLLDSREEIGYGLVATELVYYNGAFAIGIDGVYPGTAAAESGLRRGLIITEIDGGEISWENYYSEYQYSLLKPSEGDKVEFKTHNGEEYILTASSIEVNPLLHHEVLDHNIGYLVYSTFDSNFDKELESVLSELSSANISELILDLRLNMGGLITSANLLTSMIAGSYAQGQIFSYYRYNDELTADHTSTSALVGMDFDRDEELFYDDCISTSTQLNLSTQRVYCLVSNDTASASEMVINSLRGFGFEVILIGDRTNGKNVGMISFESGDIDGYEYNLLPITFENFNCQIEGGYEEGFEVDYDVNDLFGFCDFNIYDPLVATAYELITGESPYEETRSATSMLEIQQAGLSRNGGIHGAIIPVK